MNVKELKEQYKEVFGVDAADGMTKKQLSEAIASKKNTPDTLQEGIADVEEELKVMYWKNPVFFMNASLGLQKGLVTQEAKDEFERLAIKTGSGSKLEDAVLDYDPDVKRKADSKKRKGIE